MVNLIDRGMILAAGLGTRMRPLTNERPKPLMEILTQPLITVALNQLHAAGVKNAMVNTHYLGEQIHQAIGARHGGMQIHFADEPEILGTAGALKNAEAFLDDDEPFAVLNGDSLFDVDLLGMLRTHRESNAFATILLKNVPNPEKYGVIGIDNSGQVLNFVDLVPYHGPPLTKRMFCGAHILTRDALSWFAADQASSIVDTGYAKWIAAGKKIMSFEQRGYFCDVGTPDRLFGANMDLLSGRETLKNTNFFEGFNRGDKEGIWLAPDAHIPSTCKLQAPLFIGSGVNLGPKSEIGPYAVIGNHVDVGNGARLKQTVVFSGARISANDQISNMIVGKTERCIVKSYL